MSGRDDSTLLPEDPTDRRCAQALISSGVIGPEQIEEGIRRQQERAASGQLITLSRVMVEEGIVAEADLPAESRHEATRFEGEPPKQMAVERHLGRYGLLQEIGRGGMGVVWKAWDPDLRRVVALKVMLGDPSWATDVQIERFHREARAAARLRHRNIVPVFDVGIEEGHPYFTSELVEGISLAARMIDAIPTREGVQLVLDVARALDYAHGEGIVHRDVKPDNIMLDRDGSPRLMDFGLARDLSGARDVGLTVSGTQLGTPIYMSPEQAQGRTGEVGPASDQFSLGVVLYEILSSSLPFTGSSIAEITAAVVAKDPLSLRRADLRIHRDLETICFRALEKSIDRRYPGLGALADDLECYLAGEPIEARPPSLPERFWRRPPGRICWSPKTSRSMSISRPIAGSNCVFPRSTTSPESPGLVYLGPLRVRENSDDGREGDGHRG